MNRKNSITKLIIVAVVLLLAPLPHVSAEETTIQALRERGIKPLNDSALRSLIVNRTLIIRSSTTGQMYEATFYPNGNRLLLGLTDNTRKSVAQGTSASSSANQGIAAYKISDSKLYTRFSGKTFIAQVYNVDGKYLAADPEEGDAVNWEIIERTRRAPKIPIITVAALQEQGVLPLDDAALTNLIVGKTLLISNRGTNERFEISYAADGTRRIRNIPDKNVNYTAFRSFHGGVVSDGSAPYKISEGYIVTTLDGREFRTQVFKKKDQYLAASGEGGGLVNWEVEVATKK